MPVDLLLLEIAVILTAALVFGALARRLGQSPVIGEIVAGIALGPTLLGHLVGTRLFPASTTPALTALADVGLVLFMFVVGLDLDFTLIPGRGRVVAAVAGGATLTPLVLGAGLALLLAPHYALGARAPFVLYFAVSVSATAFPVLARILTDRGMEHTLLGGVAFASAAVIDVVSYALLAVAVALAGAGGGESWRLALAPVFLLLMLGVVRPLGRRLGGAFERDGRLSSWLIATLAIGLFASAWATQWMQLNFIFGAFFFGAVLPRPEGFTEALVSRLSPAVQLLLPIFFAVTGLTVNLGALRPSALGVLAAILGVAIVGKLGGGYAGSRLVNIPRRGSAVLAALVNTRGLTELVILSVGLQEHVLDARLYSLLVVMALVTTAMTVPLLRRLYSPELLRRDLEALARDRAAREAAAAPAPPG
jgi:Kef-type K+ transport system membrane component KefB